MIRNKTICLIGNSSSGLREGCYIGVKNLCVIHDKMEEKLKKYKDDIQ